MKSVIIIAIIVSSITIFSILPDAEAKTWKVHIIDMPVQWQSQFGHLYDEGTKYWEEQIPGTYFTEITYREQADFVIQWSSKFEGDRLGYYTTNTDNDFGRPFIAITIGYMDDDESIKWQDRKFNLVDPEYAQLITIHELGHAIGFDHSKNPDDIMYPSIYNYDLWLSQKQSAVLETQIVTSTVEPTKNIELESSETYQNQITTSDDIKIGLSVGQWVKYSVSVQVGGDNDVKKLLEPLKRFTTKQISESSGFNIDNAIWLKYTVTDISGTVVTFDRSVKLATNSEIKDEYILQLLLGTLSPENKIDEEILSNIYEKKLESKQIDLTEFKPGTSFVMPTNLEFGSKFEGDATSGEITFSEIAEILGTKVNMFTGHKVTSISSRDGPIEVTTKFDKASSFYYNKQSGMLDTYLVDTEVTDTNTYGLGWITIQVNAIEYSENLKSTNISKPINDKDEILEKLSYFFVDSADSEFLFTNGVVSIGEPKRTTFDIIRVSDGYELGSLILYGDDEISLIRSSTLVGGVSKTTSI